MSYSSSTYSSPLSSMVQKENKQIKTGKKGTHQVVTTRLEFPLGQRVTVRGGP